MDRRQIGTKLALDVLGVPVQVDTFDQRLIIQKMIYLAQAAGVDLGYYYRWYLRGPYSPDLTGDAFSIAAELTSDFDESEGWSFERTSQQRLENLREWVPSGPDRQRARQLELWASVHFLVTRHQTSADPEALAEVLHRYKKGLSKPFKPDEICWALTSLQNHALLKP